MESDQHGIDLEPVREPVSEKGQSYNAPDESKKEYVCRRETGIHDLSYHSCRWQQEQASIYNQNKIQQTIFDLKDGVEISRDRLVELF